MDNGKTFPVSSSNQVGNTLLAKIMKVRVYGTDTQVKISVYVTETTLGTFNIYLFIRIKYAE